VGEPAGDMGLATQNIPDDAIENPKNYLLKFEIATLEPLDGSVIHMYIGNDMAGMRAAQSYAWTPAFDTNGEWQTISIPFENIVGLSNPAVSETGYGISFWFWEGAPLNANFAADNFRVVPEVD
jgi:hypothetical protein